MEEGYGLILVAIMLPLLVVVYPSLVNKSSAVTLSYQGRVVDVLVSYGKGDATTLVFADNSTLVYDGRVPNILVGHVYLFGYLHYESGRNVLVSVESVSVDG